MSRIRRIGLTLLAAAGTAAPVLPAAAQITPYRVADPAFGTLPDGRTYGSVSAIYPGPDGQTIWVAERCGENSCVDHQDLVTIFQFDLEGNLLTSFGAGLFAWPHGMHVDRGGNVWVTDATGFGDVPDGMGHVVYEFSPEGELLRTLGRRGVAGDGPDTFRQPSDVLVAPDGSIFVADGHGAGGNNRIVKLAPDGTFLKEWGGTGGEDGQFRDPHALAMDSRGRLFVGDRANSRIQIFDQEGEHLATWTQFGRPSGLFIDAADTLYATDSESNTERNPGWRRGIYIGSAVTGEVTAFIPDPEPDPDNSATSGAEGVAVDAEGNVYGAEVGPMSVRRYEWVGPGPSETMSFFITSVGKGDGANLGGLEGADAHCAFLAYAVGASDRTWRAYLSATGTGGGAVVNARDRIGSGPWYNARGELIARDVAELHSDGANLTKQSILTEWGDMVRGRGDRP
ncbi:MAG TPA: peptidyl-alpha-hydroxyglycine alpha-amidating lyase family protein, partial [Longimicrobiales bacterium]|nr:peptidyl-alpha-hydroxyglycine alpha-amidating lyase family protein [Longimicrobiales bacterium]